MFSTRFFFGCEADDPMNALAFASDLNPGGAILPADLLLRRRPLGRPRHAGGAARGL